MTTCSGNQIDSKPRSSTAGPSVRRKAGPALSVATGAKTPIFMTEHHRSASAGGRHVCPGIRGEHRRRRTERSPVGLEIEHRPSPSPYVTRVWRATGEQTVAEMTAVAYSRWDLVFWDAEDAMHVSVVGPSVRPSTAPVPDAVVSFGINFELGTVLPQL